LINEPEFDWPLGHVYGGIVDPAKVITLMQAFDRDLGMIERAYRRAGILQQTLFVVTADHGMAPITRFVPSTVITQAVARAAPTARRGFLPPHCHYVHRSRALAGRSRGRHLAVSTHPAHPGGPWHQEGLDRDTAGATRGCRSHRPGRHGSAARGHGRSRAHRC